MPSDRNEILPNDGTRCPLRPAVIPDGEGHVLVVGQPPPRGHNDVVPGPRRGPDLTVEANLIDLEYVIEVQAQLVGRFCGPDGERRDPGQLLVRRTPAEREPVMQHIDAGIAVVRIHRVGDRLRPALGQITGRGARRSGDADRGAGVAAAVAAAGTCRRDGGCGDDRGDRSPASCHAAAPEAGAESASSETSASARRSGAICGRAVTIVRSGFIASHSFTCMAAWTRPSSNQNATNRSPLTSPRVTTRSYPPGSTYPVYSMPMSYLSV